jgi:hypothetical protein
MMYLFIYFSKIVMIKHIFLTRPTSLIRSTASYLHWTGPSQDTTCLTTASSSKRPRNIIFSFNYRFQNDAKRQHGKWTENKLQIAFAAYRNRDYGLNECRMVYGVPKATIRRHAM